MKSNFYTMIMACILSFAQLLASANELEIENAKMTRVELYRSGAQIFKQFSYTSTNRVTTVKVKGIPSNVDPSTIRAKSLANEKIVSISFETDYSISESAKKKSNVLKDSIEALNIELSLLEADLQSYTTQEQLLNNNMNVLDKQRGIEDLQKLLALQKAELAGIKKSLIRLAYKKEELKIKKADLERKLKISTSHDNPLAGVVTLEIVADPNVSHKIEVSYLVADAWWKPIYDIRVESVEKPLELEYRAEVYQNSNEDWNDIQLLLYSNNPQVQGELGALQTWKLSYNTSAPQYAKVQTSSVPSSQMAMNQSGISGVVIEQGNGLPVPFASVVLKRNGSMVTGTQTDFDGKYDLRNVPPGEYDLEVSYIGFQNVIMNSIRLNPRSVTMANVEMQVSAVALNVVEVNYQKPLLDRSMSSQTTISSNEISRMPARSASEMASTVGGTYSRDNGYSSINVRGGRDDASYYYIDGIKVRGSSSSYYDNQTSQNFVLLNDPNQQEEVKVELEAPGRQTIPSESKIKVVYLKSKEIQANYVYKTIPRLDDKVYLYAEITDWGRLGLLSGKTNLFYSNIFVGEAQIDANKTDDTLSISLGPDRNIIMSRTLTDETQNTPNIGSNSVVQAYKIELKSMKSYPVNVRIQDQIPVAIHDNFSVQVLEEGGGKVDKKTGIITWNFVLEPHEKSVTTFKFLVKYPRGVRVAVQ